MDSDEQYNCLSEHPQVPEARKTNPDISGVGVSTV